MTPAAERPDSVAEGDKHEHFISPDLGDGEGKEPASMSAAVPRAL